MAEDGSGASLTVSIVSWDLPNRLSIVKDISGALPPAPSVSLDVSWDPSIYRLSNVDGISAATLPGSVCTLVPWGSSIYRSISALGTVYSALHVLFRFRREERTSGLRPSLDTGLDGGVFATSTSRAVFLLLDNRLLSGASSSTYWSHVRVALVCSAP